MPIRTVILALLLAALGGPLLRADQGTPLPLGQPAPQFMLKTHAGDDFYTHDYVGEPRGKRFRQERDVLVLSFFASWCKPCKQEIPYLTELAGNYARDSIKFFLVNKGEEKGVVDNCVFENAITLPVLLDPYEVACKKFQLKELPTLVIIDRAGNTAFYHQGYAPEFKDSLRVAIDKALGKWKPEPPKPKVDSAAIRAKAAADSAAAAKAKKKGGKGKAPKAPKTPPAKSTGK
ncbi:MAG TPA: TlpA disulfide reductase family protein [Candidatus Edwardsbacteria bacterium]|nr:TlpA disulfide reductase family protein [Candidatus Edwardsbacteria bacterium]